MTKVALIFGGRSAEHEVSLASAKSISSALDKKRFNPFFIFIDKNGKWYRQNKVPLTGKDIDRSKPLYTIPGGGKKFLISPSGERFIIDVIFPILHGTFGEDGSVQGFFEMVDIPFVASGVLGSALSMDKEISKKVLAGDGFPVADFISFKGKLDPLKVESAFSYPLFVKPANLGSSIGISKALDRKGLLMAADEAFSYDSKIIVEEFIKGKEVECSVLGNNNPIASIPGEIIVRSEFYSYETKYLHKDKSSLVIPAKLNKETKEQVCKMAIDAFKTLSCFGMARVDFFVSENNIILNEVNTIPGFTDISMYPKLWEASGIPYTDLITKIIDLGIEKYKEKNSKKTSYIVNK